MKPEWVMVGIAGLVAVGQLVNVVLTLRVKNSQLVLSNQVSNMRQEILDRVADDYKRQDVCRSDMEALRVLRSGRAC